ncbi:MAG: LytR C-terminal domain-containing protein [Gemmatimonadaceae bacterium]|nr:LytR C-terminal domain-containing protein [Gemmatimonadaceae bacterium]
MVAAAGLVVAAVVTAIVLLSAGGRRGDASRAPQAMRSSATSDTAARAPMHTRVRVRVLNASTRTGMARRAALYLRDMGYDVVDWGTDPVARDRTQVDDHGHPEWASRVARALGGATVVARADSLRQLDLTVRLGRDWRSPVGFFRP